MQGGREGSAKGYFQSRDPNGEKHTQIYIPSGYQEKVLHQSVVGMEQLLRHSPEPTELKECLDIALRHHLNFGWSCAETVWT